MYGILVPRGTTVVSVKAVLTVLTIPEFCVGSLVTVPTTNPALVIVVSAALEAVPCSYCRLSFFG